MDKLKKAKNIFKKLIKDEKSIFYAVERITRTRLNKARKSLYEKDKFIYKYYLDLEDKNALYVSKNMKAKIPFYIPFVQQRKDIDRPSSLYSMKAPFQLVHADVADIQFFSILAVYPKYYLLAVDLFTSKTYLYPMKSRNLLARKSELFYGDTQPKRQQIAINEKMRLQTDLELQQNKIKKINQKYNAEMFSSRVRGGKACAAKQKIREFKKLLFRSKRLHKATSTKRFDPKKFIRKATENMNITHLQKYGYAPDEVEEKVAESEKFRDIYDFYRLVKVRHHAESYERPDVKKDKTLCKKLREPLRDGEKVLALAERLKKEDTSGNLYKSTTENISFFNREQVFVMKKIVKISNKNYNYWIPKEGEDKVINKRF